MKQALLHLFGDLFSTIVFVALYALTGSVIFTTAVAVGAGLAQMAYQKLRGRPIEAMEILSLALVVVFGGLALVTNNGRFIMAKPSIIHFAIGAVMLRRGWMDRYLPAIAHETLPPQLIVASGYAWAALMFALGLSNLAVAAFCDRQTWAMYITIVPLAAKFAGFGVQYLLFRALIVRRLRKARTLAVAA
jgi:intracellular septation protein A